MVVRFFLVLSAALFACGLGLMILLAPDMPLGAALQSGLPGILPHVKTGCAAISDWIWPHLAVPLLVRPAWFAPTALGLIAAGCAYSLRSASRQNQPHRRGN